MTKLQSPDTFGTKLTIFARNLFPSFGGEIFDILKPANNPEFYECEKNIFLGKILSIYKKSIKKDKLKELFDYYNGFNKLGQESLFTIKLEGLGLLIDKGDNYDISEKYSEFILKYLYKFNPYKFSLQKLMLAYIKNFESGTEGKFIDDIIILSSLYGVKISEYEVSKQIEGFRLTGLISY